jgi:transglutaminase-like putative cysteine protease
MKSTPDYHARRYPFKEYEVKHETRYEYEFPVSLSYHHLHLQPRDWSTLQHIEDFSMRIDPQPADFLERTDFFGNHVQSFSIQEPHESLVISTRFKARVIASIPPIDEITISCAQVRNALHGDTSARSLNALQFIYPSPLIPWSARIEAFAKPFFPEKRPYIEAVMDLCHALKTMIQFDPEATGINTSVEEFFDLKRGVCQDFSQLMISCIRSQDLPARYMSGYILTIPKAGEARLEGADASHAWVSVFLPGFGWIEVDPTNDLLVCDQHIRLAAGRDFGDVSLVKGSLFGGGNSRIKVAVTVAPVEPGPQRIEQPVLAVHLHDRPLY